MDINLNYDGENNLLITDKFNLFIQEIELSIKIIEGTIWNKPKGLDIGAYVFNKFISVFAIRTQIKSFITSECENAQYFSWEVEVNIMQQNGEEFLLITFTIEKGENDTRTNQFIIS